MNIESTNSWMAALSDYSYPVKLSCYEHANRFPNYFNTDIRGDRASTIDFENFFRENAQRSIEVYFEAVFWKLYSQPNNRQKGTDRIVNYMIREKIDSESVYNAVRHFVDVPSIRNLQIIRDLMGIKTDVLAVPLTFPAFLNPENYPMVDNVVAKWVNANFTEHNKNRRAKLTPFALGYTSLRDNDFRNYLNWVGWCNEVSSVLTDKTGGRWRARDVEMAVFTARRNNFKLDVL